MAKAAEMRKKPRFSRKPEYNEKPELPEKDDAMNRRLFLARGATGLTAMWASAHWPALLAAAEHAHRSAEAAARAAAGAGAPPQFEFFQADEAVEIEAITARLIPTDETPGAREAGVVYFIDRALATFAKSGQQTFREGLPELQTRVSEVLPGVAKFSAATPEQQDKVLETFNDTSKASGQPFTARPKAQNFFQTLVQHTITGFLVDPEAGGNHEGVGWKLIGRERQHLFEPPFGYYDKDYPGWQPASAVADKK